MCRNFNVFLKPVNIVTLFFEQTGDSYRIRACEEIKADLADRTLSTRALAEDCSKKSTKAGYDAAGMAIGYVPLESLLASLQAVETQGQSVFSAAEAAAFVNKLQDESLMRVKVARDGGDLLKTWDTLVDRLNLQPTEWITNWETHVRQASQGDMYSESNAHPHQELLTTSQIQIYHLTETGEITVSQADRTGGESLFSDTHNGDINDAARYKRFLANQGFRFLSNSDSCVEPALKRFIYEHLRRGELAGALHQLAYTDPDYSHAAIATVDANGEVGPYAIGQTWANRTVTVAIETNRIRFLGDGNPIADFAPHSFLRDDERSLSSDKVTELLRLAETMRGAGAQDVTIAAALVARIFEYSNHENKFVFQSFTPIGKPQAGLLGGGTYNMIRGGTERGGEEGGEIIFHIPKPYDDRNYHRISFLSASEENALKEQITLLDAESIAQGKLQPAQPVAQEIKFLSEIQATAYITEGLAPVFDVLPGEIVEVDANGNVKLFDIYRGNAIQLVAAAGLSTDTLTEHATAERSRQERLAPLKIFKVEYRDLAGQPIPCPYNKYGEEIQVIQPLALRRNTEKLFVSTPDGEIRLRTGAEGIGLIMGTDDELLRHEQIRQLTHIITGAAGTSYLINTIAGNLSRKLCLNTLPTINLDGFTGSDTIPPYVGEHTLFIANSNSGGTSDTIKLTHELASLPSVCTRIEAEIQRRDPRLPAVSEAKARLAELQTLLQAETKRKDLPPHLQAFLDQKTPWIYVITNIEASALGNIGRGLDPVIQPAAGVGITNLPEEECVGSTFAAMASLQWQLALHTYIGEVRGDISSEYAAQIYRELAQLPDVTETIVSDTTLIAEIKRMADELVGGNFDFVYTGYLDGVPEEQAHKAAEMIQEMFAGWHFFQFQHGKYAHMKRRTRYTLGSILGHNAPPPSWQFFNARAIKSAREIGPRVATSFFIAHASDRETLQSIPDYAPDFVLTYPADSIVLYPFQVIIVSHLISYFWGLRKKEIAKQIEQWNAPFVTVLRKVPADSLELPSLLRSQVEAQAQQVLQEFLKLCETTHYFDKVEVQRKTAIVNALSLLAGEPHMPGYDATYATSHFLRGQTQSIALEEHRRAAKPLDDATYLSVLKDLALELSNGEQAKQLADHFFVDAEGRTIPHQITVDRPHGRDRTVYEYDYLIEYEGLGTFYDVEPVHPPKIAKAKKGWL